MRYSKRQGRPPTSSPLLTFSPSRLVSSSEGTSQSGYNRSALPPQSDDRNSSLMLGATVSCMYLIKLLKNLLKCLPRRIKLPRRSGSADYVEVDRDNII